MAGECGWTKDYIADNLSLEQINVYCEEIQKKKLIDIQIYAVATLNAVGAAFGTVKIEKFREFLSILEGKKDTAEDMIAKMKTHNIPVEDK